jgi:hypothetical protein
MKRPWVISNQKGIAMVLAVSMIGLLSGMGVWLLVQSRSSVRITSSIERRESAFQLAEGGLEIALRCLLVTAPSPSYNNLTTSTPTEISSGLPTWVSEADLTTGTATPAIDYVATSSLPPSGWMLNAQGGSSFYSMYYLANGTGAIAISSAQGNSASNVSEFACRVSR